MYFTKLTLSLFFSEYLALQDSCPGTYYTIVVEDLERNKIIGSGTLIVEQKFIHEIALVSLLYCYYSSIDTPISYHCIYVGKPANGAWSILWFAQIYTMIIMIIVVFLIHNTSFFLPPSTTSLKN